MTADNSPMYKLGSDHGQGDVMRVAMCPPCPPLGPQPPHPDYPVMYMRGYNQAFSFAEWHICTPRCRQGAS
jgi:hypothetical protein